MWCAKCNKELSECICSDLEERLESLKRNPNVSYRMCRRCMKHYALCRCEVPLWTMSHLEK